MPNLIITEDNEDDYSDDILDSPFIDFDNNIIHLYGEITYKISLYISMSIRELEKNKKSITVKINSNGGLFEPCLSIISDLSNCKSKIITNVSRMAGSAAAIILLTGNQRICSKFSSVMFHSTQITIDSSIENIEDYIKSIKETHERIMKILMRNTNISYKEFIKLYNRKDYYLSPKECLELGIIDKIY